jgi:hypothetical protein
MDLGYELQNCSVDLGEIAEGVVSETSIERQIYWGWRKILYTSF